MGRGLVNRLLALLAAFAALALPGMARAEDGYDLWLRYAPLDDGMAADDAAALGPVTSASAPTPTIIAARSELERGLAELLDGHEPAGRGIVLGLARDLDGAAAREAATLEGQPAGAYRIARLADGRILIAAQDDIGLLYGAFAFLRHLGAGEPVSTIDDISAPAFSLRIIDHWGNPSGLVERGYSGRSIFDWWHLPDRLDPRMIDYARAEASIGINGVVVNNVNAKAYVLEPRYIAKLRRLADAWRPYGIRVYLTARFSAPMELGATGTADPLDPAVRQWWKDKADEIYAAIPDFGGFLVKANSEGQPGPQDYGRTHADGANMMAAALGDRGVVLWRAFVYSAEDSTDRAKQAYNEFVPLDGKFADNVILQVKNGPVDFQPREPFHPMFGAMPHTKLMLEGQITKEYLGFATHLAFLAPLWKEVITADTGHGGVVAQNLVGMAGVANTGSDRNWSGSHFDQANWYAFGRLAWDPRMSSGNIAQEWAAQTFSRDPGFLAEVVPMMLGSRQAVVDYMTPLGLAHQMGTGHHYGPAPWICDLARPEWNPCYYSKADAGGIGFDRTATGSDALAQYAPTVAAQWRDPKAMDEDYLLWFHHLPWDFKTQSGRALWPELVHRYDRGVAEVDAMAATWASLAPNVDEQRFEDTSEFLAIQQREARWWRDASIAYWQSVNHLPLPEGAAPPAHSLDWYEALSFPDAPAD
ncbi:alpha-glucuronidase [Altererythrobacter salegens]|uniref:Xylan alpha-1,2-glucuronidase n=1 Tax=Croceibacterium salegens TaxID=1737568 RepID=A0A6I4SYF1_9SPHN|nr:alpha-glucuronidase [Croceibacterium salegens]